jgi:hypothetical protein
MDNQGNYIIEPQFDFAYDFWKGKAIVFKKNEKYELTINYGKKSLKKYQPEATNPKPTIFSRDTLQKDFLAKYDFEDVQLQGLTFNKSLILVEKNRLHAYINRSGAIIWQEEKRDTTTFWPFNIDYKMGGFYWPVPAIYSFNCYNWKEEKDEMSRKITQNNQFNPHKVQFKVDETKFYLIL